MKDVYYHCVGGVIRRTSDFRNINEALGHSFRHHAMEMMRDDKLKFPSIGGIAPTSDSYFPRKSANSSKRRGMLLTPNWREQRLIVIELHEFSQILKILIHEIP